MKNLLLFLLILLPGFAGASVALPICHSEITTTPFVIQREQADVKHGILKRFIQKAMLKYLKKAKAGVGDGKWLAILGLVFGPLGLLLATFSGPSFLILVAGGLLLSILGLVKAKRQRASGLIRGLAVTGIVVNSLIVVLIMLTAILAAQGWIIFLEF